jgi:anaerobic glycerol-3-phosphate dehydrogenase
MDCAVVGGGVAGAIAALDLRARGHAVSLFAAHEGASASCAGTWDSDVPASLVGPTLAQALPWATSVLDRVRALSPGLFVHDGERPIPLLVSELGRTRNTCAHDPAMLDLASAPRGRIAVATLAGHPSWEGRQVARALDAEALARGEARRFAAVEIDFLRRGRDRVLHPHELAAELDVAKDDPRRGMDARYVMSEAIRAGLGGLSFDAVLVPPILGLFSDDVRGELEAAVGIPIGEAIALLPGTAGARLMRRLHHALDAATVTREHVRIESVSADGDSIALRWKNGSAKASAVIVATGKRLGGGIAERDGETRETLLGVSLDREGIEVDPDGRVRGLPAALDGRRIFACGAVLAQRSGTGGLLEVARSALVASAAVADALK